MYCLSETGIIYTLAVIELRTGGWRMYLLCRHYTLSHISVNFLFGEIVPDAATYTSVVSELGNIRIGRIQ